MPILSVVFLIVWMPLSVTSQQQYCGNELTNMLELICGGQFYSVNNKRTSNNRISSDRYHTLTSILVGKRGVADECCIKSCDFPTLQSYCLHDAVSKTTTTIRPITVTTTVPTTTSPLLQPEPTTHPIRAGGVRSRQRNRWFFLQAVGHNPTRQPFRQSFRQP